jgi:diaminohydroxyphosphoribosylaminopyrimidine deaminase/5-amino-6-(5-phosphoribosylamino)uracil reductase
MRRALALASMGQGYVEPNPMVGAVIVRDGRILGEGWHRKFGNLHAEIEALNSASQAVQGATLYVTLEPCCHVGKRPPCADAVIAAGITRVVAAMQDPFPQVAGGGFKRLKAAGIQVDIGLNESEARELNAPFVQLTTTGSPWVIAKWAMTLDGKIASHTGDSKWISGEGSRSLVHQLRGRMDAVIVGSRTAAIDNPLLTTRLPNGEVPPRIATRIVLDSKASLSPSGNLVSTAGLAPVIVVAGPTASQQACQRLSSAGCEVLRLATGNVEQRLRDLLAELGRRRFTNVLVEGGSKVFGDFFDAGLVDEAHIFIAPKIVGGIAAPSPVAGQGSSLMAGTHALRNPAWQAVDGDIYVRGRLIRPA